FRGGAPPAARADRMRREGGGARRGVPLRHDDRASAGVHPRGRDRWAGRLLLLRDERPDSNRARLLARRRRGQVPHLLSRGRRTRAEPVRDPRHRRGRRADDSPRTVLLSAATTTWAAVRMRRLERQSLLARGDHPLAVAHATCGIHAQVQASAELQLAARVDGATQTDVREALWEKRTLA